MTRVLTAYDSASVIVALPTPTDPVNTASSLTKAHITIVALGDMSPAEKELVRRELVTLATKFGQPHITVPVTNCMVLGDNTAAAAVVNPAGALWAFREALLEHGTIRNAHNKVQQFPRWVPHVTLGYPWEPPRGVAPTAVTLDRVAFWDFPFTGAEFPLS